METPNKANIAKDAATGAIQELLNQNKAKLEQLVQQHQTVDQSMEGPRQEAQRLRNEMRTLRGTIEQQEDLLKRVGKVKVKDLSSTTCVV